MNLGNMFLNTASDGIKQQNKNIKCGMLFALKIMGTVSETVKGIGLQRR